MHPFRGGRKTSPPFLSSVLLNSMKAGRKNSNLSVFVVVFSVFIFGCFMYNEDVKSIAEFPFSRPKAADQELQENSVLENATAVKKEDDGDQRSSRTVVENEVEKREEEEEETEQPLQEENKIELEGDKEQEEGGAAADDGVELPPEDCDLFTGEWVYDDATHPLYKEPECEFLTAQVTCMRNGRKDSSYQNWRWQPRDCSLPK